MLVQSTNIWHQCSHFRDDDGRRSPAEGLHFELHVNWRSHRQLSSTGLSGERVPLLYLWKTQVRHAVVAPVIYTLTDLVTFNILGVKASRGRVRIQLGSYQPLERPMISAFRLSSRF